MAIGVMEFQSPQELLKYLDSVLNDLRRKLGDLLRQIEDLRAKSEKSERLLKLIASLASSGAQQVSPSETVIEIERVKIYINPTARSELEVLENIAESINAKITKLHSIRKGLEKLVESGVDTPLRVIIEDYIPKAIIIKL
jgi:phosphate uptake regulator